MPPVIGLARYRTVYRDSMPLIATGHSIRQQRLLPLLRRLIIVRFNCKSTSSAMATTLSRRGLKSAVLRLVFNALDMLTCKMRDSSMNMGIEQSCA